MFRACIVLALATELVPLLGAQQTVQGNGQNTAQKTDQLAPARPKVFISNLAGDDSEHRTGPSTISGGPGQPYNKFYAALEIRLENGLEEGATTDSDGSLKLVAPRDPLGALLHPRLHHMIRDSAAHPGTYRFKATKDGFHSIVGTVVVSHTAPQESLIEIQLQPGYQEKGKTGLPQRELNPRDALAGLDTNAGNSKLHPYKRSDVDMPVSLVPGTVQTPEFSVISEWYDIIVQVEKPLPFLQMRCMMGVTSNPLDSKDCSSSDPLLQADWTVWDGEHLVGNGSVSDGSTCACAFEDKHIYKSLGSFAGKAGKKYIVQVKFTKDGTPLNVANPHLIVIRHGNFW